MFSIQSSIPTKRSIIEQLKNKDLAQSEIKVLRKKLSIDPRDKL